MEEIEDQDVLLVHGFRSPIGKLCGNLSELEAHEIGGQVLLGLLEYLKKFNLDPIPNLDQVIVGQVLTAGSGQNPARRAAHYAGIPMSIPSYGVNMVCGSGLLSIGLCFDSLRQRNTPENVWCLAGGQESMSRAPHYIPGMRANCKRGGVPTYGDVSMLDAVKFDGLTDSFGNGLMGDTAENVAARYTISKEEQDKFAIDSHLKYHQAKEFIQQEIIPIKLNKSDVLIVCDESPRLPEKLDGLKKLPCVFNNKEGDVRTVTAGNACPLNDGSAFVAITNGFTFKQNLSKLNNDFRDNLYLCRIVGWEKSGLDPSVMGLGPVYAIRKLCKKINWKISDVDFFEINEAFASQSIAVIRDLGLDQSKVNVGGGSIAIGHPLGASGARILVTLMHRIAVESSKRKSKLKGIASLCIGGGMGISMAIEGV